MPDQAITPKRRLKQAPIKLIACFGGCGATVERRTNPRVYCPPCKLAKLRSSARVAMEKQRRKRGVPLIKGTTTPCVVCGRSFVRERNARAKYCPPCAEVHYAEKARRTSEAKRNTVAGREYANAYFTERKKTDPVFQIAVKVRSRIHAAIRRGLERGARKSGKTIELLGCSFEEFKIHIERQFKRGMSWDKIANGEVHLDHRRPIASFDLTDPAQQREAFHYLNVQPMWKAENFEKHAKRTLLL